MKRKSKITSGFLNKIMLAAQKRSVSTPSKKDKDREEFHLKNIFGADLK